MEADFFFLNRGQKARTVVGDTYASWRRLIITWLESLRKRTWWQLTEKKPRSQDEFAHQA